MPTARSNGISIYYETRGEGKPILLIGGLGIDLTQLEGIIGLLSRTRQVTAFDNRGAGRSDKPDVPYSIETMTEDAAGLLGVLGESPTDVLGLSMGGRVALSLALAHPEMVRSLILVSTSARTDYSRGLLWSLENALLRIPAIRRIGTKYPQPYYAYVRQRDASKGYDVTGRLVEIDKPTLIIRGATDRIVPELLAEEMRSRIRGSELISVRGGHTALLRSPKESAFAVDAFLDRVDRQA